MLQPIELMVGTGTQKVKSFCQPHRQSLKFIIPLYYLQNKGTWPSTQLYCLWYLFLQSFLTTKKIFGVKYFKRNIECVQKIAVLYGTVICSLKVFQPPHDLLCLKHFAQINTSDRKLVFTALYPFIKV